MKEQKQAQGQERGQERGQELAQAREQAQKHAQEAVPPLNRKAGIPASMRAGIGKMLELTKPSKKRETIENSVALRVITSAMALTGVLAASQMADAADWLIALSVAGTAIGSYLSYKRRYRSNFLGKVWISLGIIVAAGMFFNELLVLAHANIADARVPLTKLLMLLIALHCFDLPRRRDLSVSALVGATLLTAAATLSRDMSFFAYLVSFALFSVAMFHFDCLSRTKERWIRSLPGGVAAEEKSCNLPGGVGDILSFPLQKLVVTSFFLAALSLLIFAILPRGQFGFMREFRLSGNLPYQIHLDFLGKVQRILSADGSLKSNPQSYYGFSEELDTNHRGALSDLLVLRVSGNTGSYLRGMCYDKFDGKVWTMTRPKETKTLLANINHGFDLESKLMNLSRFKTTKLSQVIYVEEDSTNLVVAPTVGYQIYFPSPYLQMDSYDGIRSPVGVLKDQVYTVFANVPRYDYKQMREDRRISTGLSVAKNSSPRLKVCLQLPDSLSEHVKELAHELGDSGTNDFAKAEIISRFLQSKFKYDLNIAKTPEGKDTVSDFLFEKKRGYCEHFASAMVVMCRCLGIPARLVTGYTPGDYNPFTGLWEVRMHHAHCWAEVWVHRYGWVPFDATPDSVMSERWQEAPSVFTYLAETFKLCWNSISESPLAKQIVTLSKPVLGLLHGVLQGISLFLSREHLNILVIGACIIAAVTGAASLLLQGPQRLKVKFLLALNDLSGKRGQKSKASIGSLASEKSEKARDSLRKAASLEFIALTKSLAPLGLERSDAETAFEFLNKLKDTLSADLFIPFKPEILSQSGKFVELYGYVRFGEGDQQDLKQLQKLRFSIDKLTRNLPKHRKREVLAK